MPIIVGGGGSSPASIVDYSSLRDAIASWLHRTDLDAEIADFIALAEYRIYRELRVRQMETALSSTIAAGVIAVPSGFIEFKNVYIDGTPVQKLEKKNAEWIYANYPTRSADGTPKFIAREATNFIFGPYPDSTYTVKGIYYKRLTALSGSNTSNWLITDAPDLILWASLAEAAPWLQDDERIAIWEGKYQQAKNRIQVQDDMEEFSGSPISVTAR